MRISDWSSDVCSSDLQLELRAIDVPARKIGILRVLPLGEPMDRAIEAPVTAVGVAVEILTEQAVVERGVEDGAIVAAAAGDADLPERAVPCGARCRLCRLDAGARRAFAIQIGAEIGRAHV